ncbi:hypothetical protein [Metabacillus fastidiosus]|uniref:hypothetical protein n=1 Tax=Metabacillus fastidiosus TaxID=1458 RepID=UPI003D2D0E0C
MIKMLTMYIVFEKLDNYYDDNDSRYEIAFDNEKDANDYVEKYSQYNYYVEPRDLYAMPNRTL